MTDQNQPDHQAGRVVYDGECPFCRRQIARFRQRDTQSLFEYLPRQTAGLAEQFPKLADADFNAGMRLVCPDGNILVGADAVYHIMRRLSPYRWVAWLYRVPLLHFLFRRIYAWIAANRHRLAGNCHEACDPPSSRAD